MLRYEFEGLKKDYSNVNRICGKLGKIYNFKEHKIDDIKCRHFNCARCRNKLKFLLYVKTAKNCLDFNLEKHFVITFKGKDYRELYNFIESFYFMSNAWNKYKQVIEYNYNIKNNSRGIAKYYGDKFSYILFPRSQKDGYCHYHIIIKGYIPWKFLNETRKKQNLGFVSIQKNKSVVDYMHTDFYKDNEWIIPYNFKHIRTSRDIVLNNIDNSDWKENNNVFMNTMKHKVTIDEMYDEIDKRYKYPIPFEELLKEFYDKIDEEDKKEIVTSSFSKERDSKIMKKFFKVECNNQKINFSTGIPERKQLKSKRFYFTIWNDLFFLMSQFRLININRFLIYNAI